MKQLKVLIITQKIDQNDDILGFFCTWLNVLAKKISKINVLTLEKGKADLAKNIELHSIDKERGENRVRRLLKLNQIAAKLLLGRKVDVAFVHMCPEYVALCAAYAKLAGIPMLMWYAHGHTGIKLKIAHLLVNRVVTSSKVGFRIKSKKKIIIGQGIDIEKFKIPAGPSGTMAGRKNEKFPPDQAEQWRAGKVKNAGKKIVLSVGRISPIKKYEILIKAADILVNQRNFRDLRFQIVGGARLESQRRYLNFLKNMVGQYKLQDYIQFTGPIPYTQIQNYYQNCDLFVCTSNTGSLDKAVLEAMACEKAIITCNEAFDNILDGYSEILTFEKGNIPLLAEKIVFILTMDRLTYQQLGQKLRSIVAEGHNLNRLTDRMVKVFEAML